MIRAVQRPKPPNGLQHGGRRLWLAVADALALDERDMALLGEAARCRDRLDLLDEAIRVSGMLLPDGRTHPALAEARQQQQTLARLIVAMRLPEDLADPSSTRPQRRGVRGAYNPRHLRVIESEA